MVEEVLKRGWVHTPNERGTLDIIWSCSATIFLCSWSVLFLNIPGKPGHRAYFSKRISWMAFAIWFPEVLAAFAQKQWLSARQSVAEFSRQGHTGWTLRHAFFADMGGFMIASPDYPLFPANAMQIAYLVSKGYMDYPKIDHQDIWDKNKADGFARLITAFQVLWFTIQCIGRAVQKLPISTFELDTVAFVLCSFITFYFWNAKPLDASTTITLPLKDGVHIRQILIAAGDKASKPFKFTPLDFLMPDDDPYEVFDMVMWGIEKLFGLGAAPKHGPITTFKDSVLRLGPRKTRRVDFIIQGTMTIAYCAIHVVAWNFHFPTPVERNLWRAASTILVAAPLSYGLLFLLLTWQLRFWCRVFNVSGAKTGLQLLQQLHAFWQVLVPATWVGGYGLARLYLIVEAIVGLRVLPAGVFKTVEWSNYLPHI